jgi:hypothetical protein
MNTAGNIRCGSEVGYQILKCSIEWFKSYRDLKKFKVAAGQWPPSWILANLNISGNSPYGSELRHQISKRSVERFKSYNDLKKIQDGRRPTAAILDFGKFEHFGQEPLWFLSWPPNFERIGRAV